MGPSKLLLSILIVSGGGISASAGSCEPYRLRYEKLKAGDSWTKISQVFGPSTREESTATGGTTYIYEFAGCRLSFVAGPDNKLKSKGATPSLPSLRQNQKVSDPLAQYRIPKPERSVAPANFQPDTTSVAEQVADLQRKVDSINQTLEYISSTVLENLPRKGIWLDPTELNKYQRLDMRNGFLLISLTSVEPYLDGMKATLDVGNPLFMSYSGFKVSVKWGKAAMKTREESFVDTLRAGSWTAVHVVLPNTSATEIGQVEINIETNNVSLNRPF